MILVTICVWGGGGWKGGREGQTSRQAGDRGRENRLLFLLVIPHKTTTFSKITLLECFVYVFS